MRYTEPHLDEVDALDIVLDLLDQLHLVHGLCLCQADSKMCPFFLLGDVVFCCLGEGGSGWQGEKGRGEASKFIPRPPCPATQRQDPGRLLDKAYNFARRSQ